MLFYVIVVCVVLYLIITSELTYQLDDRCPSLFVLYINITRSLLIEYNVEYGARITNRATMKRKEFCLCHFGW